MGTAEPLDLAPDNTGPMSTIVVVGGAGTIGRKTRSSAEGERSPSNSGGTHIR